jgi:hypothetical protein
VSHRAVTVCAAALWFAIALSGCGTDTLSATSLRARATAICTAAVRRGDQVTPPGSNGAGAAFLARGITIFRPELAALRRLAPPHGLASTYRVALGDTAQQLDALIATHRNLVDGHDSVVAIRQLDVELAAINARDTVAWKAVGAPVCTNLLPAPPPRQSS